MQVPVSQSIEVDRTTSSFRPFVADPEKQIRYEKFLTLSKLGQSGMLTIVNPPFSVRGPNIICTIIQCISADLTLPLSR